jgi:hypothetical protein
MVVEFDPTLEDWPADPHELLQFVQGIPDDGQRRLATAMARALIQYQAVVQESAEDRADLRARVEALEAT